MKKMMVCALAVGGLFAVGCGNNAGKNDVASQIAGDSPSQVFAKAIDATWVGECTRVTEKDLMDLKFAGQKVTYGLSQDNASKTTTFFDKDDCSSAAVSVIERGTLTNIKNVANDNSEIDMHWNTVQAKPLNQSGVDALSMTKFCGVDWKAGMDYTDITAKTSDSVIGKVFCWKKTPSVQYDLAHTGGNTLQLGLASGNLDKSAADKRPTDIDKGLTYSKQ